MAVQLRVRVCPLSNLTGLGVLIWTSKITLATSTRNNIFLNDGFIKQIKPLSILFSVHAFGMSLTSSICEIVCLVQMSVDCCFTGQKPYFFVCCICNYKALPTVPSYSFSIRDQSIKWKLKRKKHAIRKSY